MTLKLSSLRPATDLPSRPPTTQTPSQRRPTHEAAHGDVFERRATAPVTPGHSRDGTPMYAQGDPRWRTDPVGRGGHNMHQIGCAVTSSAMAMSKVSGRDITPGQLNHTLNTHHGYTGQHGDAMSWDAAARSQGLHQQLQHVSPDTLNRDLAAGRPAVVAVNHDPRHPTHVNHWVAVTRRERDAQGNSRYFANDPAGGHEIELHFVNGRLRGPENGSRTYVSTGAMHVFSAP